MENATATQRRFGDRETQILFLAGFVIDAITLAKGGSSLTQQASSQFVDGARAIYQDVVAGGPIEGIAEKILQAYEAMSKKYLAISEGVNDATLTDYFIGLGIVVVAVSLSLPATPQR